MADLMPNARAWISAKGSQFAMYDDQPVNRCLAAPGFCR